MWFPDSYFINFAKFYLNTSLLPSCIITRLFTASFSKTNTNMARSVDIRVSLNLIDFITKNQNHYLSPLSLPSFSFVCPSVTSFQQISASPQKLHIRPLSNPCWGTWALSSFAKTICTAATFHHFQDFIWSDGNAVR